MGTRRLLRAVRSRCGSASLTLFSRSGQSENRCHRRRIAQSTHGRHYRSVFLEPRHVFHYLTAAATLHGQSNIEPAQDAAEALRPLAGNAAYVLFTFGLIGTGMLAVPSWRVSAAYAIAEAKDRRGSLEDHPSLSRKFLYRDCHFDGPGSGFGFRWLQLGADAVLFSSSKRNTAATVDVDQSALEIDLLPREIEQVTSSHSGTNRKDHQRQQVSTRSELLDSLYRVDSGRIMATLIRLLGDFDLAEEAMHEALRLR